jgi:hypothetical protein
MIDRWVQVVARPTGSDFDILTILVDHLPHYRDTIKKNEGLAIKHCAARGGPISVIRHSRRVIRFDGSSPFASLPQ